MTSIPAFEKKLDNTYCHSIIQALALKQQKKFAAAVEDLYEVSPAVASLHQLKAKALRLAEDRSVFPEEAATVPTTSSAPEIRLQMENGQVDFNKLQKFLDECKKSAHPQAATPDEPFGL